MAAAIEPVVCHLGCISLCRVGYYAEDDILAMGVIPVFANDSTDAGKIVASGEAVGMIDSGVFSHSKEGLKVRQGY